MPLSNGAASVSVSWSTRTATDARSWPRGAAASCRSGAWARGRSRRGRRRRCSRARARARIQAARRPARARARLHLRRLPRRERPRAQAPLRQDAAAPPRPGARVGRGPRRPGHAPRSAAAVRQRHRLPPPGRTCRWNAHARLGRERQARRGAHSTRGGKLGLLRLTAGGSHGECDPSNIRDPASRGCPLSESQRGREGGVVGERADGRGSRGARTDGRTDGRGVEEMFVQNDAVSLCLLLNRRARRRCASSTSARVRATRSASSCSGSRSARGIEKVYTLVERDEVSHLDEARLREGSEHPRLLQAERRVPPRLAVDDAALLADSIRVSDWRRDDDELDARRQSPAHDFAEKTLVAGEEAGRRRCSIARSRRRSSRRREGRDVKKAIERRSGRARAHRVRALRPRRRAPLLPAHARGGFELVASTESQSCFGNAFLELLTAPEDGARAPRDGLRAPDDLRQAPRRRRRELLRAGAERRRRARDGLRLQRLPPHRPPRQNHMRRRRRAQGRDRLVAQAREPDRRMRDVDSSRREALDRSNVDAEGALCVYSAGDRGGGSGGLARARRDPARAGSRPSAADTGPRRRRSARATSASRASSSSRPASTPLWLDAHAPSWLSRGRDAKVGLGLLARHLATRPVTRICRSSSTQKRFAHARGFSASSLALVALVVREEDEPALVDSLRRTTRAEGSPSGVAVARVIAVGSGCPASIASREPLLDLARWATDRGRARRGRRARTRCGSRRGPGACGR